MADAFEFAYHPSNTNAAEQIGFEQAKLRYERGREQGVNNVLSQFVGQNGQLDMNAAIPALARAGYGREAMQLNLQQSQATAPIQKMLLDYSEKQQNLQRETERDKALDAYHKGMLNIQGGGMFGMGTPSAQPATASGVSGTQAVNGDDYLSKLPPQIGAQVKALAEGRMQFPGGFALKSPYWQQMISAVSQYDPTFDATNYNARATARKDLVKSMGSGGVVNALNTVAGHLQNAYNSSQDLGGTDYPGANSVYNTVAPWLGGTDQQSKLNRFNIDADTAASELTKAYRGAGGAEADIQRFRDRLNANQAPAARAATLREMADLLQSKIEATASGYRKTLGPSADNLNLIDPHAQAVFDMLRGQQPQGGQTPQSAAPSQQSQTSYQPGQVVSYQGKPHVVRQVMPDGSLDVVPAQ